ncbi:DUF2141 domain-containing protein [Flavobacterium zepuense]|nr:DUF2141 domain-containing protein [Flavobacterium zepuense]
MKKITSFFVSVLIGFITTLTTLPLQAQNTKVIISGLESDKGQIILNIFKDSESYEKQAPFKTLTFEKTKLVEGSMTVTFEVEPGTYGITLVDDKNKNGEMDKNLLGIPKEGFGFSNFFMEKMKKPLFEEFRVPLTPKNNTIKIKVKYM